MGCFVCAAFIPCGSVAGQRPHVVRPIHVFGVGWGGVGVGWGGVGWGFTQEDITALDNCIGVCVLSLDI
jgi:hypothetical protein